MLSEQLDTCLADTKLVVTAKQKQQLLNFVALLSKWNKAYNLTSVRNPQQMLIRHIMDSLVVSPFLEGKRFIDVGTGPGLPGIPLAIINPDKCFYLLDSLGKRIRFQKQVKFELELDNIFPTESRVENFTDDMGFDGVLSRAFASIEDMLTWCKHLPNQQGIFYALKGQVVEDELMRLPSGYKLVDIIKLDVPQMNEQRHLLKIVQEKSLS